MPSGSPSGFQWAIPATLRSGSSGSPTCARIASTFARIASCGSLDGADPDPREARGVVARRDRPRRRRGVELGEHRHLVRRASELVGDHLRADRPVPLPLRRRAEPHRDPAERVDRDGRALRVSRLRQCRRPLDRRLRERDVAHVRDRGLDDAREPDAGEPPLGARARDSLAESPRTPPARAPGRGTPRSRRSRTARPTACGRASRRPERGCAGRALRGRARDGARRSPSRAPARSTAAARRSRG